MGNTELAEVDAKQIEDHPHLRGEYSILRAMPWITLGSPPPTWGIRIVSTHYASSIRITPTYVGNTLKKARHINNHFLLYPQIYLLYI